jgi:hypothetical protein
MYATCNTVVSILLVIPMPKMCPSHVVKDPTNVETPGNYLRNSSTEETIGTQSYAAIEVIEYWWKRCSGDRTRPCVPAVVEAHGRTCFSLASLSVHLPGSTHPLKTLPVQCPANRIRLGKIKQMLDCVAAR